MESGIKRLKWTSEEDDKLTRFIHENEGTWNWASLPKQSREMESGSKRLKWTSEEDEKLTSFIQENEEGTWNWASLPTQAGLLRSANDYLRDKIDRGNFTKEEEDTISRLHQAIGNRWAITAEHLPGRSNIEIKNYWRHLKKRVHWISKPDGTSEIVVMPNSNNDKNKTDMSWANESSNSNRRDETRKDLVMSVTNLEKFKLQEANVFNNNVSGNTDLNQRGNSSITDGQDFAFLHDFESYSFEDMDLFNNIFAEDSNLNFGEYGNGSTVCVNNSNIPGEELAWPTGSNWSGYEDTIMPNNSTDQNGNLNNEGYGGRSMDVAVGEREQNSQVVELISEPVHNGVKQDDLAIDMTTGIEQLSNEDMNSPMVSTPGLYRGDLGWHDDQFLDGSMTNFQYNGAGGTVAQPSGSLDLDYDLFPDFF